MNDDSGRVRRLLVLAGAAVVLVAISSGFVALAGNHGAKASSPDVAGTAASVDATNAPISAIKRPAVATTAPLPDQRNPFDAAVQALVGDGTIDQAQADVLRRQIDTGGIDPQEDVDSGVLTAAQMLAVEARLGATKQALAAAAPSQVPPPDKPQPKGSPASK